MLNQLENELKNVTREAGPNGRMRKRNHIHVDRELVKKLEASIEKEEAKHMLTTCERLLAEESVKTTNWEKNSHIVQEIVSLCTARVFEICI